MESSPKYCDNCKTLIGHRSGKDIELRQAVAIYVRDVDGPLYAFPGQTVRAKRTLTIKPACCSASMKFPVNER